MPSLQEGLLSFAVFCVFLIVLLVARPGLVAARGGKILAFFAFFIMPVVMTVAGLTLHMEHSKTTEFCMSCHEMQPYGKSLFVDSKDPLPATHFQNRRIDQEHACYTCHTTYTMFGGFQAKLQGLKHLYIHTFGPIPEQIKLYQPYQNRECLHCHEGARSFEELEEHVDERENIKNNSSSCLDCHDTTHDLKHLDKAKMWKEPSL